jgi:AI-2 transport protein TqsA
MIRKHWEQNWLITASLVILAVVALAAALIYTRAVMIPFVVALFIVALVSPIEDFQVKKLRLPRIIAVIVTLLVVLSVITLVFLFVYQAAQTIVSTAGDYSASFAYMANRILKPVESLYREEVPPSPAPVAAPNEAKAAAPAASTEAPPAPPKPGLFELYPVVEEGNKAATLDVTPQESPPLPDFNEAAIPSLETNGSTKRELRIDTRQLVKDLRNYIFNIVTNAFGTIFGLTSGVLFVSVFVIFLLAGRNPYAEHSQVYRDVVEKIRRYVGTKVVLSAVTGLLIWACLRAMGMELAGVFGVLAFLLNFIPSIGSIIATLLPIPIAVVEFHQTPWLIVLVVAIPGAIQNIIGNLIEPKLMGGGLDLHPVTILLALSFWGLLWGIVGMFLAAPITAAIRIVLMQFEMFRPVANLLAGDFTRPEKKIPDADTTAPAGGAGRPLHEEPLAGPAAEP